MRTSEKGDLHVIHIYNVIRIYRIVRIALNSDK